VKIDETFSPRWAREPNAQLQVDRTFMSCLAGLENPAYCVICIDVGARLAPALFRQPQGLSLQLGNDLPPLVHQQACPEHVEGTGGLTHPVYNVMGRQHVPLTRAPSLRSGLRLWAGSLAADRLVPFTRIPHQP